jgi:4'-phosphopantetheinyl transferase
MGVQDQDFRIGPLALGESEVHLWRVDLNQAAANELRWQPLLSVDERERANRFHFEKDRQRFSTTRALLRMLLAAYLQSTPESLRFHYADKGKPSLDGPHLESKLMFNVSHSGDVALFAITRGREIGVDVEQVRRNSDLDAIAPRFFSAHEQAQLNALAPEQQVEAFFRCWTRKEAYIKARGEGLSLPLSQFDVSVGLDFGGENALLATRPDPEEARRWSVRDVATSPEYAAAVAVHGDGWQLTLRNL